MRVTILTPSAPAAVGPYSQAVRVGGRLYVSGQVGLDPADGRLVPGGTTAETTRALANVSAILEAAEYTVGDVVRVDIHLADMADYDAVNSIYAGWAAAPFPARVTTQAGALPLGARVEVVIIAERE